MPFSKDISDRVMVKCGRRCCVCRRFKPTLLQVHHIDEESQGGTNDEENAIPLCVNCHIDVHSKVPFTRRFSREELVSHRDSLYLAVKSGHLPSEETYVKPVALDANISEAAIGFGLSALAQEILVSAAECEGRILLILTCGGATLQAGNLSRDVGFGRGLAEVKSAMEELHGLRFVEPTSHKREVWAVTLKGYETADTIGSLSVGASE